MECFIHRPWPQFYSLYTIVHILKQIKEIDPNIILMALDFIAANDIKFIST